MAEKIKPTKKEIAFEERMAKQRAKRGFCDRDTWAVDYWFCKTISPMLKQLAREKHGFQTLDEKGNYVDVELLTEEDYDLYDKRWTDTLLRMAFLADEINEETCSMKNPFEKDYRRIHRAFEKRYGFMGQKLRTEEEREEEEKTGRFRVRFPDGDPVHGKEYKAVMDQYFEYQRKIEKYREQCKNEFFALFSKYFYSLGD